MAPYGVSKGLKFRKSPIYSKTVELLLSMIFHFRNYLNDSWKVIHYLPDTLYNVHIK